MRRSLAGGLGSQIVQPRVEKVTDHRTGCGDTACISCRVSLGVRGFRYHGVPKGRRCGFGLRGFTGSRSFSQRLASRAEMNFGSSMAGIPSFVPAGGH